MGVLVLAVIAGYGSPFIARALARRPKRVGRSKPLPFSCVPLKGQAILLRRSEAEPRPGTLRACRRHARGEVFL
jgi:hypothetical protein